MKRNILVVLIVSLQKSLVCVANTSAIWVVQNSNFHTQTLTEYVE